MAQTNATHDGDDGLCLEIIDDRGRVVDKVYVPEITPGSVPALPAPRHRPPASRRRDA